MKQLLRDWAEGKIDTLTFHVRFLKLKFGELDAIKAETDKHIDAITEAIQRNEDDPWEERIADREVWEDNHQKAYLDSFA